METNVCLCVCDCVGVCTVAAVENQVFPICVSQRFWNFRSWGKLFFFSASDCNFRRFSEIIIIVSVVHRQEEMLQKTCENQPNER